MSVGEIENAYKSGEFPDAYCMMTSPLRNSVMGTLVARENGMYHASDDGLDGYDTVEVVVPIPEPDLKHLDVNKNGIYDPSDYDCAGFSGVTVIVPPAKITQLSVTQNGVYRATDDNWDGYGVVTVNVPEAFAMGKRQVLMLTKEVR